MAVGLFETSVNTYSTALGHSPEHTLFLVHHSVRLFEIRLSGYRFQYLYVYRTKEVDITYLLTPWSRVLLDTLTFFS
jgi:hypothetical protein